jgi:Ni/Co efflux regulator RcnB
MNTWSHPPLLIYEKDKTMKKPILALITTTLAAATLITPIAAQAQTSRGELRRDRQEIREETRDLRDAQRSGTRGEIRDARGEVREARQEYREDLNDRRYHGHHGNRFNAPFRYNTFNVGVRLSPQYYGSNFRISNYGSYRLPAPGYNKRYVRHYRDLLLVNVRSGNVVRVYRGFYR